MESEKDKKSIERRYENVVAKVANLGKELRDEKQINSCLQDNQVLIEVYYSGTSLKWTPARPIFTVRFIGVRFIEVSL